MLLRLLLSSLALFELASAHAVFNGLFINGHNSPQCVRQPINNSPMTKVSSPDMRCNVGGSKGVAGICDIKPGDNVTMEMHQQPSDHTCKDQAIGGNHFGPVMIYMCSVPDAKTASGDCSWVKIAEDSYAGTTASWGTVCWIFKTLFRDVAESGSGNLEQELR
jgi:cellulase